MGLYGLPTVLTLFTGCYSERISSEGCMPKVVTTAIPFDAIDPAGPSGADLLAKARGTWTGTITWLDPDPSLVTLGFSRRNLFHMRQLYESITGA
jgi:hypothetical protein